MYTRFTDRRLYQQENFLLAVELLGTHTLTKNNPHAYDRKQMFVLPNKPVRCGETAQQRTAAWGGFIAV